MVTHSGEGIMEMGTLPKCLRVKLVSYYKSVGCVIHMGAPP